MYVVNSADCSMKVVYQGQSVTLEPLTIVPLARVAERLHLNLDAAKEVVENTAFCLYTVYPNDPVFESYPMSREL